MLLSGRQPELVAWLIEYFFRTAGRRDGAGAELRQLAEQAAITAPQAAARMPALMYVIGPQAAAEVKVQAARAAASADDPSRPGRPPSEALPAAEAARIAGVSAQAIRAACASRQLAATKHKISGEWRITRPDLAEWMERRRAA